MSTTLDTPADVIADVEALRANKTRAEQERREAARADFDELVRKVAAGETIAAAPVDATLEASGRSLAELKAAVDEVSRRRQLKAAVDEVPTLLQEQEALAIKRGDATERYQTKLAKLQAEHAAVVDPLTGRLSEIQLTLQQAKEWREELRRTYRGPAVADLAAIRERQRLANNEGASIRESLVNLRGAIRATTSNLERAKAYPNDPALPATDRHLSAKIRECEAEIVRLENRQAEIAQEFAKCEAGVAEAQARFTD